MIVFLYIFSSPEPLTAGLCVDNVMALAYFPLTSVLASKFKDVDGCNDLSEDESNIDQCEDKMISPIESLSHAFTIAAVLTASGQCLNNLLQQWNSKSLNLSLPITTLLTVVFSTFYPPNWFLSPTTSSNERSNNSLDFSNTIAKSGEHVSANCCPE